MLPNKSVGLSLFCRYRPRVRVRMQQTPSNYFSRSESRSHRSLHTCNSAQKLSAKMFHVSNFCSIARLANSTHHVIQRSEIPCTLRLQIALAESHWLCKDTHYDASQ